MTTMRVSVLGADCDDEEEGDDHDREGKGGVNDPADEHVERAAEVALGKADRRSENGAQERGERSDLEDVAGADDDPGQHVLADVVGSEPVGGRRRELGAQDVRRSSRCTERKTPRRWRRRSTTEGSSSRR